MGGFEVSYLGALGAGALSFLSPCVLPLVPPYLCFLGGVSIDQVTAEEGAEASLLRRIFVTALIFVIGFSTVFVSLGATASAIGQLVSEYLDLLAKIAGVVIIVFGLHFLRVITIPLLYRDVRFHGQVRPATLIGAYVAGLAFAFGWTPCVGPVLAAILFVAGSEDSVAEGAGLLGVYSAGLGIPFLLTALAVRPFMAFMARFKRHMIWVERVMGLLLVATGLLFLTGAFSELAYWLLEAIPAFGRVG